MKQFKQFFNEVNTLRTELSGINTILAKAVIGDSTNNHRTLTLNQTVRFLNTIGNTELATKITAIRHRLGDILSSYRVWNDRSDALDLTEFVNIYGRVVVDNGMFRNEIGRILSKVG